MTPTGYVGRGRPSRPVSGRCWSTGARPAADRANLPNLVRQGSGKAGRSVGRDRRSRARRGRERVSWPARGRHVGRGRVSAEEEEEEVSA